MFRLIESFAMSRKTLTRSKIWYPSGERDGNPVTGKAMSDDNANVFDADADVVPTNDDNTADDVQSIRNHDFGDQSGDGF